MKTIQITCNLDEHRAFNTIVKLGIGTNCEDIITAIFLHQNLIEITCKLLKAKKLKSGLLSFTLNHNHALCIALLYDFTVKGKPQYLYECSVIESMLLLPANKMLELN